MDASPYGTIILQAKRAVSGALGRLGYSDAGLDNSIGPSNFADISCSIAFRIAKEKRESPALIAQRIIGSINGGGYISNVNAKGGYINFQINRGMFARLVLYYAFGLHEGSPISYVGNGAKTIMEYPSANPVHPLHVGQLRNMLLGDSLARISEACGYTVEREDYIEELGLQAVQAFWGYLQTQEAPTKKFDHWLGEIYANVNRQLQDRDLRGEFSKLAGLMEQDGTHESLLSREVSEKCTRAQYETAFKYGIYHDVQVWEGDILREKLFERTMELMHGSGFIKTETEGEYEGCVIIDLSKVGDLPGEFKGLKEQVKVLVRKDGTPTYVAKDIAFHMWKFGMLRDPFKYSLFIEKQPNGKPVHTTSRDGKRMDFGSARRVINIIDVKQSYPQALLKLAFRLMGKEDAAMGLIHLAYGRVELEEGTLGGRRGIAIENTADGLLETAVEKARTLIKDRDELPESERERIAEHVALAAIKFEFLKMVPEKWITFSWKWALAFEGNSGPYCQYMYARAMRLMEKSGRDANSVKAADVAQLSGDEEFALVKQLSMLREMVEKACVELRPNVIAEYANELAKSFSNFYDKTPILKADDAKRRDARLALVIAFANTMRYTLNLLGIEAVERM